MSTGDPTSPEPQITPAKPRRKRGRPLVWGDQKYAYEFKVTYERGAVRNVVRAARRRLPETAAEEVRSRGYGIAAVEFLRTLTFQEYADHPLRRNRAVENRGNPTVQPPAPAPAPSRDGAPAHAFEVVFKRDGATSRLLVVSTSEASAVELVAGLDGVEAASAIRSLTLEQFRAAVAGR